MLVLSPTLPEIAREFGVSTATAGQLRAISGATGGLTAIAIAVARRRPGLRELLTAGAALVALGSTLSAAARPAPDSESLPAGGDRRRGGVGAPQGAGDGTVGRAARIDGLEPSAAKCYRQRCPCVAAVANTSRP